MPKKKLSDKKAVTSPSPQLPKKSLKKEDTSPPILKRSVGSDQILNNVSIQISVDPYTEEDKPNMSQEELVQKPSRYPNKRLTMRGLKDVIKLL